MQFNFKFSLRYRVAIAFLILGWLVSMTMSGMLYWLTINMNEKLIEETLSTELEVYISRYSIDPDTSPPSSTHIQGYVIKAEMPDSFPPQLRQLPQGLTHVKIDGSGYYVETREHNETRFLMLYADKLVMQREKQYLGFLATGIFLITLLSSILGLWLASRVISPVTSLAQQVAEMGPDSSLFPLKQDKVSVDEVDELARAIDSYHQRLLEFNDRERAFTGDISHELRTPLAVIEGATELLLSANDLSIDNKIKIERIARATSQITHLTTALLTLAREETSSHNSHNSQQYCVNEVLRKVVDEHIYLLDHKPVKVEFTTNNKLIIPGDPVLMYVVLANIIRNAFSYTNQGIVHILLKDNCIEVKDTGTGIREELQCKMFDRYYSDNQSRGGQGIGLSLVWRICKRYDWKLSVDSHEGLGTSIKLILPSRGISQQ